MLKTLSNISVGTKCIVIKIDTNNSIYNRLFELGVRENEEISVLYKSLFNTPIIVETFGIQIALDNSITNKILVK